MNKNIKFVGQNLAQKIDQCLFSQFNLPEPKAMDMAAFGVAKALNDYLNHKKSTSTLCILIGPGNNGGDGVEAAKHLLKMRKNQKIDLFQFKPFKDARKQQLIDQLQGVGKFSMNDFNNKYVEYDVVCDGLFGFSFKGPVRSNYLKLFKILKKIESKIISVDVPSGWEIEEGNIHDTFTPDANISLGTLKKCIKNFKGRHYFSDYFMPQNLLKKFNVSNPTYNRDSIYTIISNQFNISQD